MEVSILAKTLDLGNSQFDGSNLTLAGRTAGICYMADNYTSSSLHDTEKSVNRANAVIKLGHHSIMDHGSMTLLFEGIPKIVAMMLNNTQYYVTSEKSARYTKMADITTEEKKYYDKWLEIFRVEIKNKYNCLENSLVEKLAMENARYLLSVFTPTTMAYTVSYRQIYYLIDWVDSTIEYFGNSGLTSEFYFRLSKNLEELKEKLIKTLDGQGYKVDLMHDIKNRRFNIFSASSSNKEIISDVYMVSYKASFAEFAQAQRHRTITYQLHFNEAMHSVKFYIPQVLAGKPELIKQWKKDCGELLLNYPQGLLVDVTERGTVENFLLKAKERICGRAQLEIQDITASTMQKFIDNKDELSFENKEMLARHTPGNQVVTKCRMDGFRCKEVCTWGPNNALGRLI